MGERREREQAGETGHTEGHRGEKTQEAFVEQVQSGDRDATAGDADATKHAGEGRHRLKENREQHDDADKNSEANRKRVEVDKGRLDPDLPGVGDSIHGDPY